MAISYPPAAPQRGDRTTFASRVDAFITWLIGFVTELIAVVANLNSIAAGGAYSIQYTYRSSSSFVGSSAGGILAIKAASIQLDTKSLGGASVAALLSATGDSTSTLKGFIRLQKISDTSKWAVYSVTSYAQGGSGLYGDIFGTLVNSSTGGNPFADGESVMLFFDRTGDKGETGSPSNLVAPMLHLQERYADGTSPTGSSSPLARNLNSTLINTITGASLSSGQITLPAGTYDFEGSAPSYSGLAHRVALYNNTDSTVVVPGPSRYAFVSSSSSCYNDYAEVRGRFVIASSKTFTLLHYVSNTTSFPFGWAAAITGSVGEIYSELIIKKVG
jgi:hypothetical protein